MLLLSQFPLSVLQQTPLEELALEQRKAIARARFAPTLEKLREVCLERDWANMDASFSKLPQPKALDNQMWYYSQRLQFIYAMIGKASSNQILACAHAVLF